MEKTRFKRRKKTNYKRGIILVIALFIVIYLWYNAESLLELIFKK